MPQDFRDIMYVFFRVRLLVLAVFETKFARSKIFYDLRCDNDTVLFTIIALISLLRYTYD